MQGMHRKQRMQKRRECNFSKIAKTSKNAVKIEFAKIDKTAKSAKNAKKPRNAKIS